MPTQQRDGDRPPDGDRGGAGSSRPYDTDRSPWLFLLVVPVVLPLLPMIYNSESPTLIGIPFFYWFQLLLVFVSAGVCGIVYVKTRSRSTGRRGR